MSNERNGHRSALVLFAVAVIIATLMAFVTTLERADQRMANSDTAPGTTGLAKARPPLDRTRTAGIRQVRGDRFDDDFRLSDLEPRFIAQPAASVVPTCGPISVGSKRSGGRAALNMRCAASTFR